MAKPKEQSKGGTVAAYPMAGHPKPGVRGNEGSTGGVDKATGKSGYGSQKVRDEHTDTSNGYKG